MSVRRCLARAVTAVLAAVATLAPASAQTGAATTLVVPFTLERFDPRVGWLAEGTAIGLTDALAERGLDVVSRDERLAVFERLQLPATAALTRATLIKVAELLGASRVVLGRVAVADTEVTIEAQVLLVDAARLDPATRRVTPVTGLLDTYRELARAADLGGGAPIPSSAPPLAPSVPAFELYVRGLTAGAEELQERYLAQAIDAAPEYVDARLALWSVQSARGAHDQAVKTLAAVPASSPAAQEAQVRTATSLVQLRRYDDAFAALKTLAADAPSPLVANLLGVIQLRRGGGPGGRATYFFHQAAALDPADPDYCFNLGYAYWLDKDALASAYWLREAVRRDPADGDAHFVLAAALAGSGAGPEAERERELARRLSERWETAGEVVPRGLERLKDRTTPARARLDSVLQAEAQRDQRDAAAFHVEAARRAFDAGDDPQTIREAQRALYLTPYDSRAHLLLGAALARSGLLGEAADALKIAVWSRETADAQIALGDVLLRLRDVDGAQRAADRALVLDPTSADAAALAERVRAARSPGPA